MIQRQVFDNFLEEDYFDYLSQVVMGTWHDRAIMYQMQKTVSDSTDTEVMPPWNFMGISMIYDNDEPLHPFYKELSETFLPLFREKVYDYRAIVRIKCNFYPYTETFHKHRYHKDYTFDNIGAVFSINTCDGYTEFDDGDVVESVANRLVVFNAQNSHRSTTTTTDFGRFNINFNLL